MAKHVRIHDNWFLRQILGTTDQWEVVTKDTNEILYCGKEKIIIHREAKGYYVLKNSTLSRSADFVFDSKEDALIFIRNTMTFYRY